MLARRFPSTRAVGRRSLTETLEPRAYFCGLAAPTAGSVMPAGASTSFISATLEHATAVPDGPTVLTPVITAETLPASAPAGIPLTKASVTVQLTNASAISARGPVTINLYAAHGATLNTDTDTIIAHATKSEPLKIGKFATLIIPIRSFPSSLIGSTYHLIAQAVDSAGAATSASGGAFSVAAPSISLSENITSLKLPATVHSGARLTGSFLDLTIANHGNITDNGFTIDLSASRSSDEPGGSFLHFKRRTKIAAGASIAVIIPLRKAPVLAPGSFYFIALTTDSQGGISLPASGSPFVISS